jgi:hypothetical protein
MISLRNMGDYQAFFITVTPPQIHHARVEVYVQ